MSADDRLNSWKEIACFLGRTVRTVQRWERTQGLPVRRHVHQAGSTVYASSGDLERWLLARERHGEYPSGGDSHAATPEAYFHYVRGCHALRKRTRRGLRCAIEELQASLACDPAWSLAHSALAEAYVILSVMEWCAPVEGFPKVLSAANAALAIDPKNSLAFAAKGIVSGFYEADWESADNHFARALAMHPGSAIAKYWYGLVLMNQGRFKPAIRELEGAAALEPMSPVIVANVGRPYLCSHRYETAARYFKLAVELEPSFWLGHVFLGWAYEAAGLFADAINSFEHAVAISAGEPVATTSLAHAFARAGRLVDAERILGALLANDEGLHIPAARIARIYVALGATDEAFRWLELARQSRALANNVYLRYDPAFAPLLESPRFSELLQSADL